MNDHPLPPLIGLNLVNGQYTSYLGICGLPALIRGDKVLRRHFRRPGIAWTWFYSEVTSA
ncbi:hypothetical protein BDV11DRAFT_198060 [Aspergillus similis]